jgi:hypothetical protein
MKIIQLQKSKQSKAMFTSLIHYFFALAFERNLQFLCGIVANSS